MTIRTDSGARSTERRSKARRSLWAIPVIIGIAVAVHVATPDDDDDQEQPAPAKSAQSLHAARDESAQQQPTPQATDTETSNQSSSTDTRISRREYGDRWPFLKISSGQLACVDGKYAVLIADDGKTYAISLDANAAVRSGLKHWSSLDEIWRDDPNFPGTKIDITPILTRAEALCR